MTTALHAVLASTNVLQVQSQKAKSTQSTLTFVLTAALAQMFAPLVLLLRANNSSAHVNLTHSNCQAYTLQSVARQFFLNKTGCTSAIEVNFIAFGLHCLSCWKVLFLPTKRPHYTDITHLSKLFFQKIWSLQRKPLSLQSQIRHRHIFTICTRRDGRVVDYSGLENRRAERHRGFESLSLRQSQRNEL